MKLLYVTPDPPSPIRVRPYQLALALSARGHDVSVAAPAGTAADRSALEGLAARGVAVISRPLARATRLRGMLEALAAGRPLQAGYAWSPAFARALEARVDRAAADGQAFDAAQVEHLRGSAYALRLQARLPLIWDSVDSISLLFALAREHARGWRGQLFPLLDLERTRRAEGRLANQLGQVVVSAAADRAAMLALATRHRGQDPRAAAAPMPEIDVVPNGVDLERFRPDDGPRDPATLLFSGKMAYHANLTAALHLLEDIMPRVWAERPDTRLILAGASPPRELRELAAREPARVQVTGFVDDLAPYLSRASLAIAPMVYAVGIQNKLLEAMACAVPVITTPAAADGLSARDGRELLVGEGPEALAGQVLALLDDPGRGEAIGAAGRAYVERQHSWDAAAAKLEAIHDQAIDRFARR